MCDWRQGGAEYIKPKRNVAVYCRILWFLNLPGGGILKGTASLLENIMEPIERSAAGAAGEASVPPYDTQSPLSIYVLEIILQELKDARAGKGTEREILFQDIPDYD